MGFRDIGLVSNDVLVASGSGTGLVKSRLGWGRVGVLLEIRVWARFIQLAVRGRVMIPAGPEPQCRLGSQSG